MVKLVTREQWGARKPKSRITFTPDKPCTGHWNGPTVTVKGQKTWGHEYCSAIVRGIQNFHMDGRNWADIAYNWLVCPHGYVYEGRGLRFRNGANGTYSGNKSSPAICFLAGEGNGFTEAEKTGFVECTAYVAQHSSAPEGGMGHRDHKATACPGDVRYNWIRSGMPVQATASQEDFFVFESHDSRVKFVWKSYQTIAGRNPGESEVNFWVYLIALNTRHALDLILDLHGGEHKKVA